MKNIFEILKEIEVEIPEDKKSAFETDFNENYKTVAEMEKLRTSRDNYKGQLESAQTALKEFEGVDVKDLQGKISALTSDLTAKETEYQQKISDMEFDSELDRAIRSIGAKNAKAVKALLDIDVLKTSKNQADDIKKALEGVKTDNDYLFDSEEPFKNPVKDTGAPGSPGKKMSLAEAMKYANAHPDVDVKTLI